MAKFCSTPPHSGDIRRGQILRTKGRKTAAEFAIACWVGRCLRWLSSVAVETSCWCDRGNWRARAADGRSTPVQSYPLIQRTFNSVQCNTGIYKAHTVRGRGQIWGMGGDDEVELTEGMWETMRLNQPFNASKGRAIANFKVDFIPYWRNPQRPMTVALRALTASVCLAQLVITCFGSYTLSMYVDRFP